MCYRNGYSHSCECTGGRSRCRRAASPEELQEVLEAVENLFALYGYTDCSGKGSGEEIIFLIAVTPGEPMRLITEDEAEAYLPCFETDDVITGAPDTDLCMSYDGDLVLQVGDQRYLDGTALIYNIDEEGDVIPITAADVYRVQQMLEKRTTYVTEEREKMPVIALD